MHMRWVTNGSSKGSMFCMGARHESLQMVRVGSMFCVGARHESFVFCLHGAAWQWPGLFPSFSYVMGLLMVL